MILDFCGILFLFFAMFYFCLFYFCFLLCFIFAFCGVLFWFFAVAKGITASGAS